MTPDLLRILRGLNPWLGKSEAFPSAASHRRARPFIRRVVPRAAKWPVRRKAHLLVGARQVGKSSFLWERFVDDATPPLFVNAEEILIREWCLSPTSVLDDIRQLVHPKTPVFIDEAQHLDEAGLLVKGLIDGGLENPLYVTGSSAFHLESRTRESVAGRANRAMMHPFSLEEVSLDLSDLVPALRVDGIRQRASRHLTFGGYPEAWLSDNPEDTLLDLMEAFVIRDASDRFKVDDIQAFRRCLRLLAGQVGSLMNLSEWASLCGVSRRMVSSYIEMLEQTHVVVSLNPFVGGKRAEVTSRPKVYLRDVGIRNALTGGFIPFDERADRGPVLETWVAGELSKLVFELSPNERLSYWRSKSGAEVDFVLEKNGRLIGIEVKAAAMKRPTLSRSSRSFIEAYRPDRFYVINTALSTADRIRDTEVRWEGIDVFARPDKIGEP